MNTVAKLALSLGVIGFALAGATAQAQTNVISDPVGFYKVPVNPGANFISAPLHQIQTYRGTVSSISGNTINFSGSPSFTAGLFGKTSLNFAKYVAIVVGDQDQTAPGATVNIVGDWYVITNNSTTNISVDPGFDTLASHLEAGDQIEIRRLTTIVDLFGTATNTFLNVDNNGSPNESEEDVLYLLNGINFGTQIFVTSVVGPPNAYVVDGNPVDASEVTLLPDQPVMVLRKTGSPSTNITVLGQVQTKRLTHYLNPGANAFASTFPANAPIGSSNLKESGFLTDSNGSPNAAEEDLLYKLVGLNFDTEFFLNDGVLLGTPGTPGWVVNGNPDETTPLQPSAGYVLFVKPGTGGRVWRQSVPFTP